MGGECNDDKGGGGEQDALCPSPQIMSWRLCMLGCECVPGGSSPGHLEAQIL